MEKLNHPNIARIYGRQIILMKALAEKPGDRYATAGEFGTAIHSFLQDRLKSKRQGST